MAGESIYSLLLSLGAPPETIQRLMSQFKGGQPLMESRNVGMRGISAGQSPLSARPSGPYAPPSPLRR